jgi:hypothetical protein
MGAFNINITGVGGHGCERKAKPGEKLYGRCGRFTCPDCAAYDFVQRLRQAGMVREGDTAYQIELSEDDPRVVAFKGARLAWETSHNESADMQFEHDGVFQGQSAKFYLNVYHGATFTHWPQSPSTVVDDMLKNERKSGQF